MKKIPGLLVSAVPRPYQIGLTYLSRMAIASQNLGSFAFSANSAISSGEGLSGSRSVLALKMCLTIGFMLLNLA